MARTSCIQTVEKEIFVVIKQSYLSICDGNRCGAALMNYFEQRHNSKIEDVLAKQSNNRNYKPKNGDYLIEASNDFLTTSLLGIFGRNVVIDAIKTLVGKGFIDCIDNVPNPNGGKSVNHFLFNEDFVNNAIGDYKKQRLEINVDKTAGQRLKEDVATFRNKRSQGLEINVARFRNKHRYNKEYNKEYNKDNIEKNAEILNQKNQKTDYSQKPAETVFVKSTPSVSLKNSIIEKEIPTFEIYENIHQEKTTNRFIWDERQSKAMIELESKIQKSIGVGEDLEESLTAFVKRAYDTGDKFVKNSFSPYFLNLKFNEILNAIKFSNSKNTIFGTKPESSVDEFIASTIRECGR